MKKRLTLQCWNCKRQYSQTREIQGNLLLLVAYPFCEKEAVVNLAPYLSPTVEVFRSDDAPTRQATEPALDLPPVLPTQKPEE